MRQTTLQAAPPVIILMCAAIAPVFAMRDPGAGGMPLYNYGGGTPAPTAQYVDGTNLSQYVRSQPVNLTDPSGLWGSDVHNKGCNLGNTVMWAESQGYPTVAAETIGAWDEEVDGTAVSWLPGWLPDGIGGNQSYHFNRNFGFGADSRLQHFADHLMKAKDACNWMRLHNDNPEEAAKQLGISLHPLQDWVAHGDHGRNVTYPDDITIQHNSMSPQENLYGSGKTDVGHYPDDPDLDAVDGPDGRPAGSAMHYVTEQIGIPYLDDPVKYDYAIYEFGHRRITLTGERSITALSGFRTFVKQAGGCKCREYFGIK